MIKNHIPNTFITMPAIGQRKTSHNTWIEDDRNLSQWEPHEKSRCDEVKQICRQFCDIFASQSIQSGIVLCTTSRATSPATIHQNSDDICEWSSCSYNLAIPIIRQTKNNHWLRQHSKNSYFTRWPRPTTRIMLKQWLTSQIMLRPSLENKIMRQTHTLLTYHANNI